MLDKVLSKYDKTQQEKVKVLLEEISDLDVIVHTPYGYQGKTYSWNYNSCSKVTGMAMNKITSREDMKTNSMWVASTPSDNLERLKNFKKKVGWSEFRLKNNVDIKVAAGAGGVVVAAASIGGAVVGMHEGGLLLAGKGPSCDLDKVEGIMSMNRAINVQLNRSLVDKAVLNKMIAESP